MCKKVQYMDNLKLNIIVSFPHTIAVLEKNTE